MYLCIQVKQTKQIIMNTAINFTEVYTKFHPIVLNHISKRINFANHIAEELTNDVFMKVYKHLDNFNPEKSKFTTWLFNITNRVVIDYYRANKNNSNVYISSMVNDDEKESFQLESTPDINTIENKEIYQKIRKEMRNLNPKEKQISLLYFIQNMKYDEISEKLSIPSGSVKGTINRIRAKLQNKLKNVYV